MIKYVKGEKSLGVLLLN